ncbi:MAG: hypothetical protein BWY22_00424 [Bacteroidetes bacterium ADurb.Bin217]|nr:MAG: hypothetical protein BWY22_00424 [Bacteroidetes bacterium ADurb.Bin217]
MIKEILCKNTNKKKTEKQFSGFLYIKSFKTPTNRVQI